MALGKANRKITDFTDITDPMSEKKAAPDAASFLHRVSHAVRTGAAPDPNDMLRMANAFDRMLGGEPADKALDLKPKPGQRSWGTRTALDQRDRLLREAARRFYGGLPVAAQAQHLYVQLTRYGASAWARERACRACPDRHRGTIYEFLWAALKQRDYVLSARALRQILATS